MIESGVEKYLIKAEEPKDENEQTSDFEKIVEVSLKQINLTPSLDVLRRIPEVLREDPQGLTLTTFLGQVVDIEPGDTSQSKFGMAFDIGTTSIVGSLVDLSTGESLASVGGVNPQAVYGGGVVPNSMDFNPFWAPTSGNGRVSGNAKTAHFSGNGCF